MWYDTNQLLNFFYDNIASCDVVVCNSHGRRYGTTPQYESDSFTVTHDIIQYHIWLFLRELQILTFKKKPHGVWLGTYILLLLSDKLTFFFLGRLKKRSVFRVCTITNHDVVQTACQCFVPSVCPIKRWDISPFSTFTWLWNATFHLIIVCLKQIKIL